jgi:hypothetical protein
MNRRDNMAIGLRISLIFFQYKDMEIERHMLTNRKAGNVNG